MSKIYRFFPLVSAQYSYWALILLLFPILTLFGNVLVIISVCRERILQTATNYFIVSLALADLLVAVVVMPFAVYVLVSDKYCLLTGNACLFLFIRVIKHFINIERQIKTEIYFVDKHLRIPSTYSSKTNSLFLTENIQYFKRA